MSLHNSIPCLQLRLLPLALSAGDYALLGAVYCLASVFCYARQLLLAKSALAKSGLAAVVCNGIGSPVSSRLPWEHQASSIALQQYLPSRQPWRMCDRCIGSNINLDLLHAVRRRHHDLTLWSRSFVDAQEMTSVSPVKSPSVRIMATGVAAGVLRTRTIWDKLSPISTVGGLMFLAHARVQSLETRQPALLLAFSLLRTGREREAL